MSSLQKKERVEKMQNPFYDFNFIIHSVKLTKLKILVLTCLTPEQLSKVWLWTSKQVSKKKYKTEQIIM